MAGDNKKLDEAGALLEEACKAGNVKAATLLVTKGDFRLLRHFGSVGNNNPVFLIASISKPMTAAGVMLLVDRGELALSDPVRKFLPHFRDEGRELITVRHLLTHSSGLPDMLPQNAELRKGHASLDDFVDAICQTPLLFTPGTEVRYQSMGFMLAAKITECITGMPFRDFLSQEMFVPLEMNQTSLGLGGRRLSGVMTCQVSGNDDWNWNSAYWRDLAAPWGGVHSTAEDIGRFLGSFLHPTGQVLKPETVASMVANQTPGLNSPWGLGWMVKPGTFGRLCSDRTFGHFGVTGTIAWSDPMADLCCVLLTTKPVVHSRECLLGWVSDLVSEWGA
jgi:CubicO group peptidase (beta-lactamase class C family)